MGNISKIILLFFLVSCGSMPTNQELQPIRTDVVYKKDMLLNVDGFKGEGILVVPQKEINKFHIEARGDLDLFTFTTCHREETAEKAWNVKEKKGKWIFKRTIEKKRQVKMDYKPTSIEREGACPIFLGGYESEGGRHSWGFVDFETPEAQLPALINCNGSEYNTRGVSACQAKAGLIQRIIFPKSVMVMPEEGCELDKSEGKEFSFEIRKGQCVYAFMSEDGLIHRLTTLGYEQILIRK